MCACDTTGSAFGSLGISGRSVCIFYLLVAGTLFLSWRPEVLCFLADDSYPITANMLLGEVHPAHQPSPARLRPRYPAAERSWPTSSQARADTRPEKTSTQSEWEWFIFTGLGSVAGRVRAQSLTFWFSLRH